MKADVSVAKRVNRKPSLIFTEDGVLAEYLTEIDSLAAKAITTATCRACGWSFEDE